MKQLTYEQSSTPPENKGVIWIKVIPSPFSTEMRYFSPITRAWELVENNRTLEVLTDRLNTFGTIDPTKIKAKKSFQKGLGNTAETLEVGDFKHNQVYTNEAGKAVIGKLVCTDLEPETWQPFGAADEI